MIEHDCPCCKITHTLIQEAVKQGRERIVKKLRGWADEYGIRALHSTNPEKIRAFKEIENGYSRAADRLEKEM